MGENKKQNKGGDFFKTGKISDYLIYKAGINTASSEVAKDGVAAAVRTSENDGGTYHQGTEYR